MVIPAYKPGPALPAFVQQLIGSGRIQAVVVVDDGSGTEYAGIISRVAEISGVHLLRHLVNLGKGAALKTGLNYAACTFSESLGVVTADADGQHAVEDILATSQRLLDEPSHLILGARRFGASVPFRSRFGNAVTRYIMRAFIGGNISDTQTGLRGIPRGFIPELLRLKASGYDFELDMLLTCRQQNRTISEVGIRTIYVDGNRSSHFRPLLDSMRIYFVFVRFASVSLVTSLLDNLVFFLAFSQWPTIILCQALSRTVSCLFNYFLSKREVFRSRVSNKLAVPKYLLTVVLVGGTGYFAINGLVTVMHMNVFAAKFAVETVLFLFSFVVQRTFVFRGGKEDG